MTATCTIYNGCSDEDIPLLRELLSLDMLCGHSCTFHRDELGQLMFANAPSPLHWSRQGEWPWVMRNIDLQYYHRVLDVGSGWSVLKFALARDCQEWVAMDNDAHTLGKAEQTIKRLNPIHKPIHQVLGDVRVIPYPDNWFDQVVCVSVVEHLKEGVEKAITELVRVLKPGGKLLLTMDVRVKGDVSEGDFYLDMAGSREVLRQLNCSPPEQGKKLVGSAQYGGRVELIVLMIEYNKPE